MASRATGSPYQVIARKYRPQTFADLIGQEHVRTTLENALAASRLAHGYIFSGQRGTGKTTVARILARCLNCIQGPTTQPCGVCSSCLEIAGGNAVDVIEIDAASNRGINEMRELRDNVRYRPARDKFKVFIIDEAHQITNEAFNALLKTLEEPPEWTVFVMCTTEAHKIPNTIVSRCQQFNFRSVEFGELIKRLEFIAREEGVEADDESLAVIARVGEGSVRDSLSALDQAIACCGKTLHAAEVRALLGVHAVDTLAAVAEAVIEKNPQRMLEIVQELERNGESLQHYVRELSRYWRNLLVARIAGGRTPLIAASDREQELLLEMAVRFSEEDLTRYLNLTLDLYRAMQFSLQPRLHLELGLVKLVQAGRLQSIEEALAGLGGGPSTPGGGDPGPGPGAGAGGGGGSSSQSRPVPTREAATRISAPRPAPFEARPSSQAEPKDPAAASPATPRSPLSIEDAFSSAEATRSTLKKPYPRSLESAYSAASGLINPPKVFQPPTDPLDTAAFRDKVNVRLTAAIEEIDASAGEPNREDEEPQAREAASVSAQAAATADLKAQLIDALLAEGANFSADALRQSEVTLNGAELRLRASKTFQLALRDASIVKAAQKVLGRPVNVAVETAATGATATANAAVEKRTAAPATVPPEFSERVMAHPGVRRFQELFPGAQVRTVRNLNE